MSEQARERFEQIHDFDQYLTHLDLELHPDWELAFKGGDRAAFEAILKDFGADLSYGYTEEVATARARRSDLTPSQQVVNGVLVRFKERTDKWWVDNMMDITDIIRHVKGSIRTTGMRMSVPEDSSLYEVMAQQAAKYAIVVDIKCDEGEEKKQ